MALINTTKSALFLKSGATLPVPTEGFIETTAPVMIVPEIASSDYKRISGKLNTADTYADTCNAQVNFGIEHQMRSNDSAGTALDAVPEYGELLKICGFDETISAGTGVTYTNTQSPTLGSAVAYLDSNEFDMTNSLTCDMAMNFTVGMPAKITANLQGYVDDPVPTESVQPDVILSDEPLMIVSCSNLVTLGGVTLKPDVVTFSTNPEISDFYTMGGADGLKSKALTDYALTCVVDFYADNEDYDREILAIRDQTTAVLEVLIATDADSNLVNGKSMKVTCDLVKTTEFNDTDDQNVLKRSVTYRLTNNASDIGMTILLGTFA